jgi:hypothetical protein
MTIKCKREENDFMTEYSDIGDYIPEPEPEPMPVEQPVIDPLQVPVNERLYQMLDVLNQINDTQQSINCSVKLFMFLIGISLFVSFISTLANAVSK